MARTKITTKRIVNSEPTSNFEILVPPSPKKSQENKKRKRKSSVYTLIKQTRNDTNNVVPQAPLKRLIREIVQNSSAEGKVCRITKGAQDALIYEAENFIVEIFEKAEYIKDSTTDRMTLNPQDIVAAIRSESKLTPMFHDWIKERSVRVVAKQMGYITWMKPALEAKIKRYEELIEKKKKLLGTESKKIKTEKKTKQKNEQLILQDKMEQESQSQQSQIVESQSEKSQPVQSQSQASQSDTESQESSNLSQRTRNRRDFIDTLLSTPPNPSPVPKSPALKSPGLKRPVGLI